MAWREQLNVGELTVGELIMSSRRNSDQTIGMNFSVEGLTNHIKITGSAPVPINMDSIAAYESAVTSGARGNIIKANYDGAVTHTATTAGLIVKNYTNGGTINGNYELNGMIVYLKHKETQAGGAKSALLSLHRHGSSTTVVDYGIRIFTANSQLTTMLYASGTMTNFLEVTASGAGGVTVGNDGMTADPESDTEDGYVTVVVGGTSYQIPMYAA